MRSMFAVMIVAGLALPAAMGALSVLRVGRAGWSMASRRRAAG